MTALPPAAANLLGFARLLRAGGFIVAPEQVVTFMQGVTLLGPRSMKDIHGAACTALAPPPDRMDEFEALFRSWFWGDAMVVADGEDDEETRIRDDGGIVTEKREPPRRERGGELSSGKEQLGDRISSPMTTRASSISAGAFEPHFRRGARFAATGPFRGVGSTCGGRCARSSAQMATFLARICDGVPRWRVSCCSSSTFRDR